ncbi:MAG: membrane protein [Pirellulaceae bacterium]|nr:MAG: membrane protein [Pirellulaceae bacterium]
MPIGRKVVVMRRPSLGLLWLLLFTGLVRTAAMYCLPGAWSDPDGYGKLAVNLVEHRQFALYPGAPTSYRPPLYPLLLASTVTGGKIDPLRVAALHVVLGVATVAVTYALARRWGSPLLAAWMAGAWVAVNPVLVYQSTRLMTETLATLLVVATGWMGERWMARRSRVDAVGCGILFAGCALCRAELIAWFALFAGMAVGIGNHSGRTGRWSSWLVMVFLFAAVCLPWWLRNYHRWGTWILTTTHGGYTLWLANNDDFYDYLWDAKRRQQGPWSSAKLDAQYAELARAARYSEPEVDRRATRLAWQTMRRRPREALYAVFYRWGEFWNPWPRSTQTRPLAQWQSMLLAGIYCLVYVAAVCGVYHAAGRRSFSQWWIWISLVVALHLVHAVYWTNARMRAPVEPLLALLAIEPCAGRRDSGR